TQSQNTDAEQSGSKGYEKVDVYPEFPGGQDALFEWIGNNITYPDELEGQGVEGTVIVSFVVQADGSVADAMVVKSLHKKLDKISIEAVNKMPDWKPGEVSGNAVNTEMKLPFRYVID
ncbi:MAG: energy transducer TonB, partial [Flavobacteriales bacterium]|nr:energy transducer TonB [Flavobacteriales bacterium]